MSDPQVPGEPPLRSSSGYDLTPLEPERIAELCARLTPEERRVTQSRGTEQPGCGLLLHNQEEGTYACVVCDLPLFSSQHKFTSGSGWPSFFTPFDPDHIRERRDESLGVLRTEIACRRCDAHLGHVFPDGPQPTGLRFCLNSAALRFHAAETEVAYFAGGCFWGVEDAFGKTRGVLDAVSGYQGGEQVDPTYEEVCSGQTGHAETVKVVFDPTRVTYRQLLQRFFAIHDPTTPNRQGPDVGSQYRSAIFTTSDEQRELAQEWIAKLESQGAFPGRPIVTVVEPAGPFYEAEAYHQDYHARHGGSCGL